MAIARGQARITLAPRGDAGAALRFVDAGQAIMLDDSSTATMLADHLGGVTPLTVVTNSVGAAERLQAVEDIDLISLGGTYNRVEYSKSRRAGSG